LFLTALDKHVREMAALYRQSESRATIIAQHRWMSSAAQVMTADKQGWIAITFTCVDCSEDVIPFRWEVGPQHPDFPLYSRAREKQLWTFIKVDHRPDSGDGESSFLIPQTNLATQVIHRDYLDLFFIRRSRLPSQLV